MQRLAIVVGLAFLLALFGVIWYKATRETPEQQNAKWSLEALDGIVKAWEEHEAARAEAQYPEEGETIDVEKPFRDFAANLKRVNLDGAGDDVKAVHARMLKYADEAPVVLRKFKIAPLSQPTGNRALDERAAQDWSLNVQNQAIQMELLLRGADDEIGLLRAKYERARKR